MAIREIRLKDDEILSKVCKEVKVFDKKLEILLDDMYETMVKSNGVGLAAPQVGILKRVAVIDIDYESEDDKKKKRRKAVNKDKIGKIELINPVIIEQSGSQIDNEGCLSVPKVFGEVERPNKVTVRAQNRKGEFFEITGTELLARAMCHEIEHLDGKLFLDRVIRFVDN